MKRYISVLLVCLLLLTGCGQTVMTWQEQYDLGVRYLSEGNYEEAILAFNAAIEIDPKQPEAYVGLADAYVQLGDEETAKNFLKDAIDLLGELDVLVHALEQYEAEKPSEETTDVMPEEPVEEIVDLTGEWVHEQYPRAYYMTLKQESDGEYTFFLEAVRGNLAQIATAEVEHVKIEDGTAEFSFTDSFGNSGMIYLTVDGEKIDVQIDAQIAPGANWGVNAGAGTYVRFEDTFRLEFPCVFVQDDQGAITQEEYRQRCCSDTSLH